MDAWERLVMKTFSVPGIMYQVQYTVAGNVFVGEQS